MNDKLMWCVGFEEATASLEGVKKRGQTAAPVLRDCIFR